MLVFEQFDGDDMPLAWRQHDVYHTALGTILTISRRHYCNACIIVGVSAEHWPADTRIDHRFVQDTHDILAAAWRWRVSPPQLSFTAPDNSMSAWLTWLTTEVGAWSDEPGLILSLSAIVRHPYTAIAEAGSLRLERAVRKRHADVPWHARLLADS